MLDAYHNILFHVQGSVEVGLVIDSYCDVPCKIIHVASGIHHLYLILTLHLHLH